MKNIAFLLALLLGVSVTTLAQDTCQVFTIPNPHGAAMTVSRVWVLDSINFTVESVRAVPFNMGATDTWDARVCITARDGESHTTIVRYQTTHGPASYQVTMMAPATTGVADNSGGVSHELLVYPKPSTGVLTLVPSSDPGDMLFVEVFDGLGILQASFSEQYNGIRLPLDLSPLPNGAYRIVVRGSDGMIERGSVLLVR